MNASAGQTDILLNAGTNELEVLVFMLGDAWYGINVAKVREVILPPEATTAPECPEGIVGIFNIRGQLVPMIDLAGHLGLQDRLTAETFGDFDGRVIICEFNSKQIGFLVDSVDQIRRMSWESVKPAPEVGDQDVGIITGVIELEERLVLMIDFESVADEVSAEGKLHIESVENELGIDRGSMRVLLAEDSKFMRDRLYGVLMASGYTGVELYSDGASAWKALSENDASKGAYDAVVSDIEMPGMDGLHLCKRIKETPGLKGVPVLLFSSLISADNQKKGREVGADYQIAKPELASMVRLVDRLVSGRSIEDVTGEIESRFAA